MARNREAGSDEQPRSALEATSVAGSDAAARADRQSRLDKIEYLISVYRMQYMHQVWRDQLPEAEQMAQKIDRLLERWQRVHGRDNLA